MASGQCTHTDRHSPRGLWLLQLLYTVPLADSRSMVTNVYVKSTVLSTLLSEMLQKCYDKCILSTVAASRCDVFKVLCAVCRFPIVMSQTVQESWITATSWSISLTVDTEVGSVWSIDHVPALSTDWTGSEIGDTGRRYVTVCFNLSLNSPLEVFDTVSYWKLFNKLIADSICDIFPLLPHWYSK